MSKNKHMNAFATPMQDSNYEDLDNHDGLSKLEYFTAAAMQGLLAHHGRFADVKEISAASVKFAEAVLNKLEKEQSHG